MTQTHLQSNDSTSSSVLESPVVTGEEPQEQEQSQTVSDPPIEHSAELKALLASLQQEQKQRHRWFSVIYSLSMTSYLSLLCIVLISRSFFKYGQYLILNFYFFAMAIWLGSIFFSKKAARRLAQLDDLHCVGPLVEIWGGVGSLGFDRKTRKLAAHALTRLLPRLKASDAELLNEKQRAILRNALDMNGYLAWGRYRDTDFLVAILKAFEQIGDWRCEPHVRRMAETSKNKRVQEAARNCLPYLEALAIKGRVGENLLRSSDKPASGPDVLLRPATGNIETAPQQLLHPVDSTTEQAHAE
jgi:hypothetical protein